MTIVPIEQYPMPRQWPMRAQSVPNIPRGSVGMVGSLRIIFEYVANGTSANAPVAIPGSSSNVTLGVCCQRLRPTGLVRDKRGSWELSPEAGVWALSGDDAFLAATLCSNIKFMGKFSICFRNLRRYPNFKLQQMTPITFPGKGRVKLVGVSFGLGIWVWSNFSTTRYRMC